MITVTELRSGKTFKDSGSIWQVLEYRHVKMGRGSATIRVKVKNLNTGAILEKTFNSGQRVEEVEVIKKKAQYLYSDADSVVFMDSESFDQFKLPKRILEGREYFLREGSEYDIITAEDRVLDIELPNHVVLKVVETGPGVKGDSISAVTKDAILENGLKVKVPLFINQGDFVKIDTRTGEYIERVKEI